MVLLHIQPRMAQQRTISEIKASLAEQSVFVDLKVEEFEKEVKLFDELRQELREAEAGQAALEECSNVLGDRDLRRASDAPVTGSVETPLRISTGSLKDPFRVPEGSLNGSHGPFQGDADGIIFGRFPKLALVAPIGLQAFWHEDAYPLL